jgi:hypothetical protein
MDDWTPPVTALLFSQLDERVAVALTEENAYWNIGEVREHVIARRCEEAGHGSLRL